MIPTQRRESIALLSPSTGVRFCIAHLPPSPMLSALHTIEERGETLPKPLLSASSAPSSPIVEVAPPRPSLGSERHRILQEIHTILSGWYASGAANISIDGVTPFDTADRCIAILERSRLEEIQRVHGLLSGKR